MAILRVSQASQFPAVSPSSPMTESPTPPGVSTSPNASSSSSDLPQIITTDRQTAIHDSSRSKTASLVECTSSTLSPGSRSSPFRRTSQRNCIIFKDNFFSTGGEEDGVFKGRDLGVYDMENGSIAALTDYPDYSKLFWPPPDWILSTTSGATSADSIGATEVQTQFEELTL